MDLQLTDKLHVAVETDWLIILLALPTDWLAVLMTEWLTIAWLTDHLNDWLADLLTGRFIDWLK